eukprot:COSAG06_NODE_239_length_19404_cov_12.723284_4_plen_86_part_00
MHAADVAMCVSLGSKDDLEQLPASNSYPGTDVAIVRSSWSNDGAWFGAYTLDIFVKTRQDKTRLRQTDLLCGRRCNACSLHALLR